MGNLNFEIKLETIFEWNQPYDLWWCLVKNGQFVPDAGFSGSTRPVWNWESSDDKERKSLSLFYEWFLNDDLNDFDEIDESQSCLSP